MGVAGQGQCTGAVVRERVGLSVRENLSRAVSLGDDRSGRLSQN